MKNQQQAMIDYQRIAQSIRFLEDHFHQQPALKEIAAEVGLSEFHFQRLFSRWAGISPKRFLQFLTLRHAKQLLQGEQSILDTAYDAGLSSPSRLHDLFVTIEAMSPGEYKRQGADLTITYGFHQTRFGESLVGVTNRGICGLAFVADRRQGLEQFRGRWPKARLVADGNVTESFARRIFSPGDKGERAQPLPVL